MATKRKTKAKPVIDLATVEEQLVPVTHDVGGKLQIVNKFEITDDAAREIMAAIVVEVRTEAAALEEQRKTITGPLNEAKRAVDALFKPVKDMYDAMNRIGSGKMSAYDLAKERQQQLALEAVQQGDRRPEVLAVAHATPDAPEGLSARYTYEYRVTDASAIPREFLAFDPKLLDLHVQQCVRGGLPVPVVPGVQIEKRVDYRRKPT